MNLEDLLKMLEPQQPASQAGQPWDYKTATSPVPPAPAPQPGLQGLDPAMFATLMGASQAPKAFDMEAKERGNKTKQAREAYRASKLKPLPEKAKPKTNTTPLGFGLSLLGEFLAQSMNRDAYRPGQVIGGYMQGVGQRRAEEAGFADDEYRNQMLARQQEQDVLGMDLDFAKSEEDQIQKLNELMRKERASAYQKGKEMKGKRMEQLMGALYEGNLDPSGVSGVLNELKQLGQDVPPELADQFVKQAIRVQQMEDAKAKAGIENNEAYIRQTMTNEVGSARSGMMQLLDKKGLLTQQDLAEFKAARDAMIASGNQQARTWVIPTETIETLAKRNADRKFTQDAAQFDKRFNLEQRKFAHSVLIDLEEMKLAWENLAVSKLKNKGVPTNEALNLVDQTNAKFISATQKKLNEELQKLGVKDARVQGYKKTGAPKGTMQQAEAELSAAKEIVNGLRKALQKAQRGENPYSPDVIQHFGQQNQDKTATTKDYTIPAKKPFKGTIGGKASGGKTPEYGKGDKKDWERAQKSKLNPNNNPAMVEVFKGIPGQYIGEKK